MKIYIDVGHGGIDLTGSDTGATGVYAGKKFFESEINLKIALVVKQVLTVYGHKVTLSREGPYNKGNLVGSYNRADSNLINSAYACRDGDYDCMVSIHNNSSSKSTARGYQIIYKTGDATKDTSSLMANEVGAQLSEVIPKNAIYTSIASNGKDNYGILRLHNKPGILIECLFMSNEQDMALIAGDFTLDKIGKGIALGIDNFAVKAGFKYVPESNNTSAISCTQCCNIGCCTCVPTNCTNCTDKKSDISQDTAEVKCCTNSVQCCTCTAIPVCVDTLKAEIESLKCEKEALWNDYVKLSEKYEALLARDTADVNNDGKVNKDDVIEVLNKM